MRGLLIALVFACLPSLASAAGALDGSYALEGPVAYPTYVVVLQNGELVGLAVLDTYFGWTYGVGPLQGNHVTGDLLNPNQSPVGRFDFTFGPEGVFAGTLYDGYFEEAIPVVGKRFF